MNKDDDIITQPEFDKMFPSLKNYSLAMYLGNEPSITPGSQWLRVEDNTIITAKRWGMRYGEGESINGKIIYGKFSVSQKISIHITGENLWITDQRWSGKTDVWECSQNSSGCEGCHSLRGLTQRLHELEEEKIQGILNHHRLRECIFGRMMRERALAIHNNYLRNKGMIK